MRRQVDWVWGKLGDEERTDGLELGKCEEWRRCMGCGEDGSMRRKGCWEMPGE